MSDAAPPSWDEAVRAAAVFALGPAGIGGVALRAPAGVARDRWLGLLRGMVAGPVRKLPASVAEDRLLGGLDLAATLAAGAPRRLRGALCEADGGVVVLAMAERLPAGAAARIALAQDAGAVDGEAARFGFVLLDEGIGDECPAVSLMERAGVHLDLTGLRPGDAEAPDMQAARALLPAVEIGDAELRALCEAAARLGVRSGRACLLAMRAARGAAALAGRTTVAAEDVAFAARVSLAPRATALGDAAPEPGPDPMPEPDAGRGEGDADEASEAGGGAMADRVLEAARAAIPAGLLAGLQSGASRTREAGRVGAAVRGLRGRQVGTRAGMPGGGLRLDLVETLRAAAPWQRLRGGGLGGALLIRRDDLRVMRREQKAGTTTVFVVDASGSAALNRLAEAKGAVELLLADCYVRRDQVAMVAFRGRGAQVALPPTRSLVRAKRGLAGLPGGGGTPLAAGIEAGLEVAGAVRRRGGSAVLVLLTDGQANVGRDGRGGRGQAREDAVRAARMVQASGLGALVVDTGARAGAACRELAGAMGGRYLALPYADAGAVSRVVRGLK